MVAAPSPRFRRIEGGTKGLRGMVGCRGREGAAARVRNLGKNKIVRNFLFIVHLLIEPVRFGGH